MANIELRETCGGGKKASSSRDILLALKDRVAKLEGSTSDVSETLEEVDGRTIEMESRQDQLKEQV
ncbi:hypothetical protein J1N35_043447, partial [Gossypium stocksii]